MKFLVHIVFIGFVSLSLFGFLGMLTSSEMAHAPTTCLASLAQNGVCPPEGNTLASALFHTSAFKVFSTTLLSTMAMLMALAFICVGFALSLRVKALAGGNALVRRIDGAIARYLALRKLRLALVRFEHSPTSF